ncbi:hypothetical protein BURK2_02884 [Burkholderiales bacterium]|nr:MAG: hypothetical protein F9K47_13485 [Burkholderiales bacterium]CAG0999276.1 hypothetical protein BURK2_02884 [Burkholderiales bacterium]
MLANLKSIFGAKAKAPTLAQLETAAEALAVAAETAQQNLDALLAQRDELVLRAAASDSGDELATLRQRIATAQAQASESAAALRACQARLAAARATVEAAGVSARWQQARELIAQRDAEGVRLASAIGEARNALAAIGRLEDRFTAVVPRPRPMGAGWGHSLRTATRTAIDGHEHLRRDLAALVATSGQTALQGAPAPDGEPIAA